MARDTHPEDPRGLIREAYRIENITEKECRTIFLDWALERADGGDMVAKIETLIGAYAADAPDHPMSKVLEEGRSGAAAPGGRRGGWRGRRSG